VFHLVIAERAVPPDPETALGLLVAAFVARGVTPDQAQASARLRFAGIDLDLAGIAESACAGRTTLPPLSIVASLGPKDRRTLDRLAPETIPLPSGRAAKLVYGDDGTVSAAVKLQELFGLADSPRVGRGEERVVFELLAPSGRPVQTTSDLASFWNQTYPIVRKELRGRYPRHPWPEDPWSASATHRTKPRGT
jgi:ATP-dependent helicase HrpB